MIGIFGMLSASKGLIVPGLDKAGMIAAYSGDYMGPFASGDASLPGVPFMLDFAAKSLQFP